MAGNPQVGMLLAIDFFNRQRRKRKRDFEEYEEQFIEADEALVTQCSALFTQAQLLLSVELTTTRVDRKIWRKRRGELFFDETLWPSPDEDFKANLRVTKATFLLLCRLLRPVMERSDQVRLPISVERRVAAALWWLGSSSEYRTVASLFGIATSTMCSAVHEFCAEVCRILKRFLIRLPQG